MLRGFRGIESPSSSIAVFEFTSNTTNFSFSVSALVIDVITERLPSKKIDISGNEWSFINEHSLADDQFHMPKSIGMLIGADVLYEILLPEFIKNPNVPTLQASKLGWLICGPYSTVSCINTVANISRVEYDRISQFWELEEVPKKSTYTVAQSTCEEQFVSSYRRINGIFSVRLPVNKNISLGESRNLALQRLKKVRMSDQYRDFMDQYEKLGHMSLITSDKISRLDRNVYYIPHHAIYHGGKIRVVFDASMKTSNGFSLNDSLFVGPKLQSTIFEIFYVFDVIGTCLLVT